MRLTIVPGDSSVYVEGSLYTNLDLSTCNIPSDVHAFQWYETYGELEFKRLFTNGEFVHPANQIISELPEWASSCKVKWDEAKAQEEAARLAAEQAALEAALAEQAALEAALAEQAAATQTTASDAEK